MSLQSPFPLLSTVVYEEIKSLSPKSEPRPEPQMMPAQSGDASLGSLNVEKYLTHFGIKFRVKPDGGRTIYALDRCLFADQHTTKDVPGDSSVIQGIDGKLGYQCFHNHCTFKTWQDARQAISGDEKLAQFCQGYVKPSLIKERGPILIDPAICEADQFLAMAIPVKRNILEPWLREGQILLISAWRGMGKTWFTLSFCDAVTRGLSFGPWKLENSVPVFYLDGEMAAFDTQERLKQLKISTNTPRKVPFFIYSDAYANSLGIPRANLLKPKWRAAVKKILIEKQIKLFVVDNISSLAPGIEENSKFEWDPVNQWLLELRFSGITTVLLHHVGKEGNQRGTSVREDNLDCSIILQRPHDYMTEEGARFVLKFKKARVPTRELSLMGDVEFCLSEIEGRLLWTWSGVKRKNQIEILKMLDEGVPQKDIAQALGVTAGFVSQVKSKAIGDGYLSRTGKLTESGFLMVSSGGENEEMY